MSTVETRGDSTGWIVWRRNIIEAVPRLAPRRDATLPAIIMISLLVHGVVLVALFWRPSPDVAARPQEIPVELVQLPPPEVKKPPPKPPERQAEKPPAKPQPPTPKPAQKPAEPPKPPVESASDRLKDLLGPIPPGLAAAALPGETQDGSEEVGYSRIVMSRIAKAKKEGRYPGTPGSYATVEFVLGDGGEVARLDLRRPSGDASLDAEAIALVKRAEPYPPPPPGERRDFVVTLEFRPVP